MLNLDAMIEGFRIPLKAARGNQASVRLENEA
jgi:hypothetical protein